MWSTPSDTHSDHSMQRFILVALCIAGSVTNEVKDASAQKTYGHPSDYGNLGYNQHPSYGQGYGNAPPYGAHFGYEYFRPPHPPLIDRDVCDLDASVLLVVSSRRHSEHRHHHHDGKPLNRAHRVRCSVIANYDEDSCNACCQHAARRDKNLKNSQFVGFLAVTNDFESWRDKERHDDRDEDDHLDEDEHLAEDENMRLKRSHDDNPNKLESLKVPEKDFMPTPYYKNVKCVCCAPKRPLPQPPVYQAPPIYQQPYSTNSQQPQDSPSYISPPAASQPTYPSLSQQSQASPSNQPSLPQPSQSQPSYLAPSPQAPPQLPYQAAAPPVASQPLYKSPQDHGVY